MAKSTKRASIKRKSAKRSVAPDQPSPTVTTRKQAEDLIRSIPRTCRGPVHEERQKEWSSLMAEGRTEEARGLNTRTQCGADFNETILAEPFDGAEHETTCKQCGTVTSWRSPVFPDLKGSKEKIERMGGARRRV